MAKITVPKPYDEDADPDKFWTKDTFDHALPKCKGFVTDLVYFMRGMEVPTLFTVWSALWLLSTIIKREAWIKWYPSDLYSNLYVIFAGPAGTKKSTTIDDVGIPILNTMQDFIPNDNIRNMKNICILKDKMTPEALLDSMIPGNKPGKVSFIFTDQNGQPQRDQEGRPVRYKATSEAGVILSEMSTSIGKKSYTEGFIEILLDLYNPRDTWEWRTKTQGKKKLERTFLSVLAATTPSSFKESIPKVAAGDGFLSRAIIVYQNGTNREFPKPKRVINGPTKEELAKRLAWIAEHSLGEYELDEEANKIYEAWYHEFKEYMRDNPSDQGLRGRMDINLLKVAFLLKCQQYDNKPEDKIGANEIKDAINIIRITYSLSQDLMGEIGENLTKQVGRVITIMRNHQRLPRTKLLQKSHIKVNEINEVIAYLVQMGVLTITLEGKKKTYPSSNGNEIYEYNDEEGEEYERCRG